MSEFDWLPLESNPDVMNSFLAKLGVPTKWGVTDIVSLDEELLDLVPTPVHAVLLLFPISEVDNEYCRKQEELAKSNECKVDQDLYFMKQTIPNGCGVVALIHAIANNIDKLNLGANSEIRKFIENTSTLGPKEKSEVLETCSKICGALKTSYPEGRSLCVKCDFHFIAIVHKNSRLYELDGRKLAPVVHGPTTEETFFRDAACVVREYMKRDSANINFNALAFGAV